MTMKWRPFSWQAPLTILASVAASLAAVWALSQVVGFTVNNSVVAALSVALSAAGIAIEERRTTRQ